MTIAGLRCAGAESNWKLTPDWGANLTYGEYRKMKTEWPAGRTNAIWSRFYVTLSREQPSVALRPKGVLLVKSMYVTEIFVSEASRRGKFSLFLCSSPENVLGIVFVLFSNFPAPNILLN